MSSIKIYSDFWGKNLKQFTVFKFPATVELRSSITCMTFLNNHATGWKFWGEPVSDPNGKIKRENILVQGML